MVGFTRGGGTLSLTVGEWLLLGGGLVSLLLFLYWLLFLTEGAYLGKGVVVWLYDLYARRYDKIKEWSMEEEIKYLVEPLLRELGPWRRPPLILDAAAGTGRLPRAVYTARLLPDATWLLLDGSAKMLAEAQKHLQKQERVFYLRQTFPPLPFADDTFDVVTCLEALEFIPQPEQALAELVRVLRPGGYLLITNRVGWIARLMPGRTWSQQRLFRMLQDLGQRHITIRPFLVDYQWVSSVKAGAYRPPARGNAQKWIAYIEEVADLVYNRER